MTQSILPTRYDDRLTQLRDGRNALQESWFALLAAIFQLVIMVLLAKFALWLLNMAPHAQTDFDWVLKRVVFIAAVVLAWKVLGKALSNLGRFSELHEMGIILLERKGGLRQALIVGLVAFAWTQYPAEFKAVLQQAWTIVQQLCHTLL